MVQCSERAVTSHFSHTFRVWLPYVPDSLERRYGATECDLGTSFNVFLNKEVANDSSYGIDWNTFKLYADELGYYPTCENFKNMPRTIYNVLFKLKYWDSIGGDKIKNQGIANVLVEKPFSHLCFYKNIE